MQNNAISKSKELMIERRINPLIMAFAFFWFIFNWKAALVFIFDDVGIEAKIAYIETMLTLQTMLVYPLIVATLFLVIYPFSAYHIYRYLHYFDKRKQLIKLQHECEVMEAERKRTELKCRLKDSKYNSEVRIERDKIDHRYSLVERKYELRMKKLEYEVKNKELHRRTMPKPELSLRNEHEIT